MSQSIFQNNGTTGNKFSKNNINSISQNSNYLNINIDVDIDIDNSDYLKNYDSLDDKKKTALVLKMFKFYKASTDQDQIFRLLRFIILYILFY